MLPLMQKVNKDFHHLDSEVIPCDPMVQIGNLTIQNLAFDKKTGYLSTFRYSPLNCEELMTKYYSMG